MKSLLTVIVLLSIGFSQDTLTFKSGLVYNGLLLGISNGRVVFKPVDSWSPQRASVDLIDYCKNQAGEYIDLQSDTLIVGEFVDQSEGVYSDRKPEPPQKGLLSAIGGGLLVVSGICGLVALNREIPKDADMEEIERFLDTTKMISNIHYGTLLIGGLLIYFDNSTKPAEPDRK